MDIVDSINSFEYLTEVVIILAIILVGIIAIIVYRIYLNRKRPYREQEETYYNPPVYPGQPAYPNQQQAPVQETEETYYNPPVYPGQPTYPEQQQAPVQEEEKPAAPPQQPEPTPMNAYPGSIIVVGNYTLFDDRIQISPRKCVFYDEITNVRYESNFTERVVVTIGHAWELSLTADDQTLKLYNGIMTKMNSEIIVQHLNRRKRMISR